MCESDIKTIHKTHAFTQFGRITTKHIESMQWKHPTYHGYLGEGLIKQHSCMGWYKQYRHIETCTPLKNSTILA